ncbi:hypothetical protein GB927_012915 [Shinella sp. CPCC 100929]|uniref:Phage tail protein n=1 Tax=Shinella lacus TaxID=2654216 RepID=A0ABT1R700_9HYPH|nr:hypothetical protein [Shinella lacus]MCQ4630947.1 hypothetical protein [Shinella lacus]
MTALGYKHGSFVESVPEGSVSFTTVEQGTFGILGTAPAADAGEFPINQPIGLIGDPAQIEALGATGTLRDQINNLIVAAGGSYLPRIAIVRVTEGADAEATIANMVGSAGSATGWHAFKHAKSELGFKPKTYMLPGFTQRISNAANPVVAAMVPWLERQRSRMLVGLPTAKADALAARADFSSMALDLIAPRVLAPDPDTGLNIIQPAEAFVAGLGLKIMRDGDIAAKKPAGFWVSWSNSVIGGIVGTERPISFDYTDADTEATLLNENRINTIVREGGWRYWGGLTASNDDDWMFSNVVRTRYALEEMVAAGFAPVVDAPMQSTVAVEAISSLGDKLLEFKEAGAIIDGRAFFLPELNQSSQLRRGIIRFEFDAEETPPMHAIIAGSRRNKKYFDVLVEDIVRDLAAAA